MVNHKPEVLFSRFKLLKPFLANESNHLFNWKVRTDSLSDDYTMDGAMARKACAARATALSVICQRKIRLRRAQSCHV